MSVINTETDRKGKTVTYATGVVEFVKLDKFDEPKTFHWDGKAIVSTHRASILVKEKGAGKDDAGVWIGLGDIELKNGYENLQVKDGDNYITIEKGIEVSVDITKVDEYNGKTYYNSKKSQITVTSTAGVQAKAPAAAKGASTDKAEAYDNTGVLVGHAVGGAASLAEKGIKGDLVELAKVFHSATTKAKEVIAEKTGQNANGRNLGMSVGNAVNSAVKLISKTEKDVEGFLVEKAVEIYTDVTVPVTEWIKAGSKTETPKQEKVTKPAEKTETIPASNEPPVDFDDDIPF